jgi:hypothetical protein
MWDVLAGIATETFVLLARMAPYLALGFAVAGALHVLLPMGLVARQLGNPGLGSVFKAAAIGVPLPLCSCGVVPVAASLKKSGASRGAVVSFLISTPTTGVDSILATYSLLGGAMAVARVYREAGDERPDEVGHRAHETEIAEIARAVVGLAQRADEVLQRDVEERKRKPAQRRGDVHHRHDAEEVRQQHRQRAYA